MDVACADYKVVYEDDADERPAEDAVGAEEAGTVSVVVLEAGVSVSSFLKLRVRRAVATLMNDWRVTLETPERSP